MPHDWDEVDGPFPRIQAPGSLALPVRARAFWVSISMRKAPLESRSFLALPESETRRARFFATSSLVKPRRPLMMIPGGRLEGVSA